MPMSDGELTRLAVLRWELGGDPLVDWRYAGSIVDKMRADEWDFEFTHCCMRDAGALFSRVIKGGCSRECHAKRSESPTRAITLAALLAVKAVTEEQV